MAMAFARIVAVVVFAVVVVAATVALAMAMAFAMPMAVVPLVATSRVVTSAVRSKNYDSKVREEIVSTVSEPPTRF